MLLACMNKMIFSCKIGQEFVLLKFIHSTITFVLDTLGVLARTVGEENFRPLAQECVQLGVNLLAETTDPDLRRCM